MESKPIPPANPGYRPTGVVDLDGNPYVVSTNSVAQNANASTEKGGDGGGGAMKMTLPDLRWNVALLNGAALLFTAALVGMFLWMIDRIDDRFDQMDAPLRNVQMTVSGQTATLDAMKDSLIRIEEGTTERDNVKTSAGIEQPITVREGTPPR